MKKILHILTIGLMLLIGQLELAKAQYVIKEADVQYGLFNYSKAIDLYEQAYKKKATLYAAEKLGECYKLQNNYKQAESWYAIATGMPNTSAENILNYAKVLQGNSKYGEAKVQYQKYADSKKDITDKQQSLWFLSCDSAMRWMKSPTASTINNQKNINTTKSDWGTSIYGNSVVFSSDRGTTNDTQSEGKPFLKFDGAKVPDKEIYGWTGNHYLKLYQADKTTDSISLFPIDANTDYHVGPASFTADGKEMYFTLTRIPKKPVYVKGKLATVNIEIYSSKKDEENKWGTPVSFKYNKVNEYSLGDPFISKDGNSLYFVSNMEGGAGGTDMYVSQKTDTGDWGIPLNLKELNTEGNERTPVFDEENNFFFSSDGRIVMGGLDIFKAKLIGGKISEPKNMGYPTNSPQDDFAYMQTSATSGFFSSNRTDGLGDDDIYSFTNTQILAFRLSGKVLNKKTNEPLANSIVTLSKTGGQSLKVQTDESGDFKFNLDKASDYKLTGEKTNFRSDGASLTTNNLTASTELKQNLYLEQIEIDKAIRLENIYYDFDRSNIRPDAAAELDKLVKIMKDNPTIWVELGSHTDSRGDDKYNQRLSQSRANSAVQYIIERGIDKNRITAKGYGESQLLNKCSNSIKCNDADHQLNRRTEFKIVKQ
ncbi:flagellar motor protein MotB [Pedobacter psychrodurus]|uniref:Flagellar motor protein MotB n=1 Tax=Pedobacter psychrodurus TaxID=2530456 RepID=A0A4R0PKL8_9SPHI|nr:OmpA family protein [Pedobacter psychrodurus]TCD18110.1 flagellar motor protein MotB [Pedobacter psychrodurus]